MGRITEKRRVVRLAVGQPPRRVEDTLAVEEPLDIRVGGTPLTVTMRTPGHDVELAIGLLLSEGIIAAGDDVFSGEFCPGATVDGVNTYNVLDLTLAPGIPPPNPDLARTFLTNSACGVCGKTSIDAVRMASTHANPDDPLRLTAELVAGLPAALRAEQRIFDATGGLHAAGLADGATGTMLAVREDVGRHNAVDKVIGWAACNRSLPLTGTVLTVSGRASFELVQKAFMAGIPALVAVSAPSSLAVQMARDTGITLVGFTRGESMVVYSGAERITT